MTQWSYWYDICDPVVMEVWNMWPNMTQWSWRCDSYDPIWPSGHGGLSDICDSIWPSGHWDMTSVTQWSWRSEICDPIWPSGHGGVTSMTQYDPVVMEVWRLWFSDHWKSGSWDSTRWVQTKCRPRNLPFLYGQLICWLDHQTQCMPGCLAP